MSTHSSKSNTQPADIASAAAPPNEQAVEKRATERVLELQAALTGVLVALQPGQRRRALKPRNNAEQIARLVHQVATANSVAVRNVPLDGVETHAARATELEPLRQALASLLQSVEQTMIALRSQGWAATLAYYKRLRDEATRDPNLAVGIQPIVEQFAQGKNGTVEREVTRVKNAARTALVTPRRRPKLRVTVDGATPAAPPAAKE